VIRARPTSGILERVAVLLGDRDRADEADALDAASFEDGAAIEPVRRG
jgi:hypothetical protein